MTGAPLIDHLLLRDERDTRALGAVIAGSVRAGDTVILSGGLGAGKTTLVKGFVEALDCDIEATSPTFALCHRYEGSLPVAHVDCWRMENERELDELALDELLEDGWVALIEWGERFLEHFGSSVLVVSLAVEREHRVARLSSMAPRWLEGAGELNGAMRKIGIGQC